MTQPIPTKLRQESAGWEANGDYAQRRYIEYTVPCMYRMYVYVYIANAAESWEKSNDRF